jgi:hypothetical protein
MQLPVYEQLLCHLDGPLGWYEFERESGGGELTVCSFG